MKPILFLFSISCLFSCQSTVNQNHEPSMPLNYYEGEDHYNVAFLIMEGVYNSELIAPWDIFHHTKFRDSIKTMKVFSIAKNTDTIRSFEDLILKPDFAYSEKKHPRIDILVVPSAEHHLDTDLEDEEMIQFVQKTAQSADYVMSLCDGAFVLAKAGLLDGKASTTFPGDLEKYKEMFPQLDVHMDKLFVHDGKYITSAGGAKSFEAALYLSEVLYGKKVARRLARGLVIDWDKEKVPHFIVE